MGYVHRLGFAGFDLKGPISALSSKPLLVVVLQADTQYWQGKKGRKCSTTAILGTAGSGLFLTVGP